MFKGQFQHNLDDKGRLVLPAKFREELGSCCVATLGFDHCVKLYTTEHYEEYAQKLLSAPDTDSIVRRLQRITFGSASDLEIDKSGRVKIPDHLFNDAGISKEVTIVGMGSVIEIWATDRWIIEEATDKNNYESDAQAFSNRDRRE